MQEEKRNRSGADDLRIDERREAGEADDSEDGSDVVASEVEKGKAAHLVDSELRELMETSSLGAPSAGEAVKDLFSTDEIFHRILATADSEFSRSNRLLFLSGLAAGLSIGLSFLARVSFAGALGDDPTGFLENAFYPIGFIFIILGRQQLFTENTLTPVTLVMMRLSSLPRLLKLWGVVYVANIMGAAVMALLFSSTDVLNPEAVAAGMHFAEEALAHPWMSLFVRGMIAGFMVAGMVWLLHAVRDSMTRFVLVYVIFFLVPSTGLQHCIIGACEIAFYVFEGGTTVWRAILDFELPITLGNTVGGIVFVAMPNFFQSRRERFREWEKLSWHDWLQGKAELAGHKDMNNG